MVRGQNNKHSTCSCGEYCRFVLFNHVHAISWCQGCAQKAVNGVFFGLFISFCRVFVLISVRPPKYDVLGHGMRIKPLTNSIPRRDNGRRRRRKLHGRVCKRGTISVADLFSRNGLRIRCHKRRSRPQWRTSRKRRLAGVHANI